MSKSGAVAPTDLLSSEFFPSDDPILDFATAADPAFAPGQALDMTPPLAEEVPVSGAVAVVGEEPDWSLAADGGGADWIGSTGWSASAPWSALGSVDFSNDETPSQAAEPIPTSDAGPPDPVDHGGAGDDVIILDGESFARGGNGPGGGGGGGGDPNILTKYVSGDPGGYNIEIQFKGTWTTDLQTAFIASAEQISDIVLGDVADVFFRGKIIDDITITAELKSIDGTGGILGQAGPTAIRTNGYLPATATMQFDSADATTYDALGLWGDIITHEMFHCIGFGTIWTYLGLVDGSGTDNPIFTGTNAISAYDPSAAGVPLEQDGGPGTVESHWDEETFFNEIMTGYIDWSNYLSDMTIASLEDLGYDTTWQDPLPV